MSERSIEAFGRYHEGEQKLDYFICGVAGALFAYIGQHYIPRKLHLDASVLEPMALLFIGASFFFALKRIGNTVLLMRVNHLMLHAAENAGKITGALAKGQGGAPFFNEEAGDVLTPEQMAKERESSLSARDHSRKQLDKLRKKGRCFWRWRNYLLALGIAALFASKILLPYFPGNMPVSPPATATSK